MSSSRDHKDLGVAQTLGELAVKLQEAIDIAGADAPWNGYDDGSIYIHPEDTAKWCSIDSSRYGQ